MPKTKLCLLLLIILLCGCGKADPVVSDSGVIAASHDTGKTHISVSHSRLSALYDVASFGEGDIYGCYIDNTGANIYTFSTDSSSVKRSVHIDGAYDILAVSGDTTGNIFAVGVINDAITLWKVDHEDNIYSSDSFVTSIRSRITAIKGLYVNDVGYCFLWCYMDVPHTDIFESDNPSDIDVYATIDRVFVFDNDLRYLYYDEVPDCNGHHLVSLLSGPGFEMSFFASDPDGYYIRQLKKDEKDNPQKDRLDETLKTIDFWLVNNASPTEDGFAYLYNGEIHSYSIKDGSDKVMLRISEAGIYEKDILCWRINAGSVEIIDNFVGSDRSEYTLIKEGTGSREVVTAGITLPDEKINKAITAFNRSQDTIQIEPIIYVDGNDYTGGIDLLRKDILDNNAPDLIFIDGIDYDSLVSKGMFEDLYQYMEKDEILNKSEIAPCITNAYEEDGHLYSLGYSFNICTMWGKKSLINGKRGISFPKLKELLEKENKDTDNIYGLANAEQTPLDVLIALELNDYIDRNNRECEFEQDSFYELLKLAKEYDFPQTDGSIYDGIRNGNVMMTYGYINSVADVTLQRELYGEEIDFIGYPVSNGFGGAVSMFDRLTINSKSDKKWAAWEFVRFYVTGDYDYPEWGFPCYVPKLEQFLNDSLNEKIITDEYGSTHTEAKAFYGDINMNQITIYRSEPEDVEKIRELIGLITTKVETNEAVRLIIEEEAEAYLMDQKSAEQVAEIIQRRVWILLQEQD